MKVLLINPPSPKGKNIMRSYSGGFGDVDEIPDDAVELIIFPPIELLIMASIIRNEGISFELKDYQIENFNEISFKEYLLMNRFDTIILTMCLPSMKEDCDIASLCKEIKNNINVFIRTSIPHIDIVALALKLSKADAILLPDATIDIIKILNGYRGENMIYYNAFNELTVGKIVRLENIDLLPLPARDLVNAKHYTFPNFRDISHNNISTMHSSYGCPYPCFYYCPYPLSEGRKMRMHSAVRVVTEFEQIKNLGIKGVVLRDPVFSYNKERVRSICTGLLDKNIKIHWWCETRIDCLDLELLTLMKKAGCSGIEVGIESGDETVLKMQAKTGLNLYKIWQFKSWADSIKMHIQYLFIFGLPMETRKSIYYTVKLILDMNLNNDEYNISFITPYPGTPLFMEAKEKGWIIENWDMFSGYTIVARTDNMSKQDMQDAWELSMELKKLISDKEEHDLIAWDNEKCVFLKKIEDWANNQGGNKC